MFIHLAIPNKFRTFSSQTEITYSTVVLGVMLSAIGLFDIVRAR